jgi:hypothetical protein
MNALLERVYLVCETVRIRQVGSISFKKLIGTTRKTFKDHNFDLLIKTKKEKSLNDAHFYVMAYYDADEDFNQETPIEVYVHHNFDDAVKFQSNQITEFLIQIYDAVVHELRHQQQSRQRNFGIFSDHSQEPYSKYLADPDELDAYAVSIAIELLRAMPISRAKLYMTRLGTLSKMRRHGAPVSPNLQAYFAYFGKNPLMKRLSKKVYKHLELIDKRYIFL